MAVVVLSSACGSAASTGTPATGHTVTVTWRDKAHTVSVARGTRILLKLNNTYWHVGGSSNSRIVKQTVAEKHRPAPKGTCLPGIGCGTTTASFLATAKGVAHLRASRSTCGEALPCSNGRGRYDVTIAVR